MAEKNPASCVGLHYTGGTKPMAVHAYRLVKQFFPNAIFSYLDPRRLALQVDGRGIDSNVTPFFLAKEAGLRAATKMDMDQLAALHGYVQDKRPAEWASSDKTLGLMDVCHSIAHIWECQDSVKPWLDWLNHDRLQTLPDGAPGTPLRAVRVALESMCHASEGTTPALVAKALRPYDEKEPTLVSCDLWFRGLWLEELADNAVNQIVQELPIRPAPLRCWYKAGNGEFFDSMQPSCTATNSSQYRVSQLIEKVTPRNTCSKLMCAPGSSAVMRRVSGWCVAWTTQGLCRKKSNAHGTRRVKFGFSDAASFMTCLARSKDWVKTANP